MIYELLNMFWNSTVPFVFLPQYEIAVSQSALTAREASQKGSGGNFLSHINLMQFHAFHFTGFVQESYDSTLSLCFIAYIHTFKIWEFLVLCFSWLNRQQLLGT